MVLFTPGSITEAVFDIIAGHDLTLATRYQSTLRASPLFSPVRDELGVLNSYWQDQLSSLQYQLNVDTLSVRERLCPSLDPQSWVNIFHQHVLPLVLHYNLPLA